MSLIGLWRVEPWELDGDFLSLAGMFLARNIPTSHLEGKTHITQSPTLAYTLEEPQELETRYT